MKQATFLLLFLISFITPATAQNFMNGDLDGVIAQESDLPTYWQSVPYTNINCDATGTIQATPDLTDLTGPNLPIGLLGNPFAGSTFVSGLYAGYPTNLWHEGIMQTVSGFTVDEGYTINFRQAVVKQNNALDKSGSWAVYVNDIMVTITNPTYSPATYNSTSFIWEPENVFFIADDTSQVIMFLPMDDDANYIFSTTDITAGLRMGIDSIHIDLLTNPKGIENVFYSGCTSVYPNPFNQFTTVRFCNEKQESCTLTLYNYCGQLVMMMENITTNKADIEKENLPAGIYAFRVSNKKEIIASGKLVIE